MADGVLVPQPARRLDVRRHRADAGAALPPRRQVPHVEQAPTHDEDLSTKPACQQSYVDTVGNDPRAAAVDRDAPEVLLPAAGRRSTSRSRGCSTPCGERGAYENTIVIFSSDHGDMQGAHGGMHEKWHVAYEEALHVPFIVSSPLLPGGARELDIPTNHADLIPTLLGLAGIDPDEALAQLQSGPQRRPPARRARPLRRDPRRRAHRAVRADPLHHRRRDQRGQRDDGQPVPARRQAAAPLLGTVTQPNHLETVIAEVDVDGEQHLVKFSRYYDNAAVLDRPRRARRAPPRTQDGHRHRTRTRRVRALRPHPSTRSRNATSPTRATPTTAPAACRRTMLELLVEQLATKRLVPDSRRGARLPATRRPCEGRLRQLRRMNRAICGELRSCRLIRHPATRVP